MKIRELLQTELWSKRTARRILTVAGATAAVLVLVTVAWYEIELHWLTSSERTAAKAALVEIDLLQSAELMDGKEFDLREKKAQLKFEAARDEMRTSQDKELVATLSTYFTLTTYPWDEARYDLDYPVSASIVDADRRSELKRWRSDTELRKQLRSALHKELD